MTSVAAAKKGGKICIAVDSLSLYENRKEVSGRHIYGDSKVISLGPGYLGFSGFAGMDLILQDYLKKNSVERLDSVDQIFGFFCDLRKKLQESYFLTREETGLLPFYQSGVEFLIVNQNGIFEVEYSGVVRCHLEFSAIGSGEEYALGAMAGVYNTSCDAEEIARVGVDAAAEFNRKTALPIDTFCVSPS